MRNDTNFKQQIKQQFLLKSIAAKVSRLVELELTNKCHNGCSYCGVFDQTQLSEINFNDLTRFLDTMAARARDSRKQFSVSLCGGDPLLYSQFEPLVLWLKQHGIPFIIKANPSTMTRDRAVLLRKNGCEAVRFTLFGNRTTHNANRGRDTIEELENKTKMLKELGIPVMWNLTLGKINLDQTLSALPFILAVKPDGISIGRLARMGTLARQEEFTDLTPKEYRSFLLKILEFYYDHYQQGFTLMFKEKLWIPLLIEEGLLDITPENLQKMVLGCEAQGNLLTINQKGEMLACGLLPTLTMGSIGKDSWEKAYLPDNRPLSLKKESVCSPCTYFSCCKGCRAIALANSGGLYNKDPQCWVTLPGVARPNRETNQ